MPSGSANEKSVILSSIVRSDIVIPIAKLSIVGSPAIIYHVTSAPAMTYLVGV